MAAFYLDTSAMVKLYAQEDGTARVRALADPSAGHDLYTVRLAGPEMVSALARKAQLGGISQNDASRATRLFRADWHSLYTIVEVAAAVCDRAMDLAQQHTLSGYDAVHVAGALVLHDVRESRGMPRLTFVSSDAEQLRAAVLVGLLVEDPSVQGAAARHYANSKTGTSITRAGSASP